jgi:hypothetical protein
MTAYQALTPAMQDIRTFQNEEKNLRKQVAKHSYYTKGNRIHFAGSVVALAFALSSPFVLLYQPQLGPLLGALAGGWVFLARLVLEPIKQWFQTKGATAQEAFDCQVLGLTWNDTLAYPLSEEEIRSNSKSFSKAKVEKRHRDWYPAKTDMPWPKSVITCQRSNAVWARRQHSAYGNYLVCIATLWALAGIATAVIHGSSLAEYLTTIALPSLPALLDATELAKRHYKASARRRRLEKQTDVLFNEASVTAEDLREIQDLIFTSRKDAPPVAAWFYKLLARDYEADMIFAANERADRG